MFRLLVPLAMASCVAGCVDGAIAPGTLPKGSTSGMYTTVDVQTVASCIATAIGSTVQSAGGRLVIASVQHPGLSYSVGPNRRNAVYPTQIAVSGVDADSDDARHVAYCAIPHDGAPQGSKR